MRIDLSEIAAVIAAHFLFVRNLFRSPEARTRAYKNFSNWCDNNGLIFLASFILACFTYFAIHKVSSITTFDREVQIRGKIEGDGSDITLGFDPPTVTVTFRGTEEERLAYDRYPAECLFLTIRHSDILTNNVVKEKTLKSKNLRQSTARGSIVPNAVKFSPAKVRPITDKIVTREFPLSPPQTIGSPTHRSFVKPPIILVPSSVMVTAGQKELEAWALLGKQPRLAEINLNGRSGSFVEEVAILPPEGDSHGSYLFSPKFVKASVTIERLTSEKTFSNIPIALSLPPEIGLPPGSAISPTNANVSLSSYEDTLLSISPSQIHVHATITNSLSILTNEMVLPLSVSVPAGALIFKTDVSPSSVRLFPGSMPISVITNTIFLPSPSTNSPPTPPKTPEALPLNLPSPSTNSPPLPPASHTNAPASTHTNAPTTSSDISVPSFPPSLNL